MSKRLIMILTLAFVVGIAFAAYAEVQNVKVSGDILLQGLTRTNLILRSNNQAPGSATTGTPFNEYDHRITGLLSHIRVRIDADLTDDVSAVVRLINERLWGDEYRTDASGTAIGKAHTTDVQLDLAYVTLKDVLKVIAQTDIPLTLTLGRQELHFGNDFIIGEVNTNLVTSGHGAAPTVYGQYLPRSLDDLSLRKSFDAIRGTFNFDPLVLDLVYAKISENRIDINDDVDLFGMNANYALDKNTTIEGYFWERRRAKAGVGAVGPETQESHTDTTRTIGARAQYSGVKNLIVGLEGAYQFGKRVNANATLYPDDVLNDGGYRRRKAYAIQLTSQYNLSELITTMEPMAGFNYTLLSGDPYRSRNKIFRGWDPMYENQTGGTLFNKILGYSNAQLFNGKFSIKPMEDLKLVVDYYYLRLMKAYRDDGPIQPTGVVLTGVVGDPTYHMVPGKKSLGNEIDAALIYDYTEDVQFGLAMGWFIPGGAFHEENDKTASQVIGSMKVTF